MNPSLHKHQCTGLPLLALWWCVVERGLRGYSQRASEAKHEDESIRPPARPPHSRPTTTTTRLGCHPKSFRRLRTCGRAMVLARLCLCCCCYTQRLTTQRRQIHRHRTKRVSTEQQGCAGVRNTVNSIIIGKWYRDDWECAAKIEF